MEREGLGRGIRRDERCLRPRGRKAQDVLVRIEEEARVRAHGSVGGRRTRRTTKGDGMGIGTTKAKSDGGVTEEARRRDGGSQGRKGRKEGGREKRRKRALNASRESTRERGPGAVRRGTASRLAIRRYRTLRAQDGGVVAGVGNREEKRMCGRGITK